MPARTLTATDMPMTSTSTSTLSSGDALQQGVNPGDQELPDGAIALPNGTDAISSTPASPASSTSKCLLFSYDVGQTKLNADYLILRR